MAWILPKGSTIYEKVNTFPGHRFDSIKTTSRDRKIDDSSYDAASMLEPVYCIETGWVKSNKRKSDYVECTGGYCKIDDLVHESAMPEKPAKSAKPSKATAKPKTPTAPKVRKTPFRSLFVKGSEWKFKSDCRIEFYRIFNRSIVSPVTPGSPPLALYTTGEHIAVDIKAGTTIKPLGKSEIHYPILWGFPTGSGDLNLIPVEIGSLKAGKMVKDGYERSFRILIEASKISDLVEQSNDFTPKSYVVEVDGEMYQENIYGGYPSKSEIVHMNPEPARSATSWVTNLGIGCTTQYSKAKKYKTLQAAKAGIMYMTGYTEGADGINEWSEGGGFTPWKKKWRISTWDKTTKTKVEDVDVTPWVYELFKYRDLVQEYGGGTRDIIKKMQAGDKFGAVMVLERWDGGEPVYDELLPEEKAQVTDLLKETILDKSEYLVRSKESSVTIGFKNIGDAMMFKLAYGGSLGIRMFDLEKMEKVI